MLCQLFTVSKANVFFKTVMRPLSTTISSAPVSLVKSWSPHSEEYLKAQMQAFKQNNIPATLSLLESGTELIGLNVNVLKDHFFSGPPLRKFKELITLTTKEKSYILKMRDTYFAKMFIFKVDNPIKCITTTSEGGETIYHVHPQQVKMEKLIPFNIQESKTDAPQECNLICTP